MSSSPTLTETWDLYRDNHLIQDRIERWEEQCDRSDTRQSGKEEHEIIRSPTWLGEIGDENCDGISQSQGQMRRIVNHPIPGHGWLE